MGVSASQGRSFRLGRWEVLAMRSGDGCATVPMCLMKQNCALKMVKVGESGGLHQTGGQLWISGW